MLACVGDTQAKIFRKCKAALTADDDCDDDEFVIRYEHVPADAGFLSFFLWHGKPSLPVKE